MTCIFIPGEKGKFGAVLCVDRAVDLRIQVGRKLVLFEDSEQWGPSLINQRGEILAKQPRRAVAVLGCVSRLGQAGEARRQWCLLVGRTAAG